jgi:hypothetical protein
MTRLIAPVTRCHVSQMRDTFPFWDMSGIVARNLGTYNSLERVRTD